MFTYYIKFDKHIRKYRCIFEPNFKVFKSDKLNKNTEIYYLNSSYLLDITFDKIMMKVSIGCDLSNIEEIIINYILNNNFGIYKKFRIAYEFNNEKNIYYFEITNPDILIQLI